MHGGLCMVSAGFAVFMFMHVIIHMTHSSSHPLKSYFVLWVRDYLHACLYPEGSISMVATHSPNVAVLTSFLLGDQAHVHSAPLIHTKKLSIYFVLTFRAASFKTRRGTLLLFAWV